jgi:hypothetical protein
MEAGIKFLAAAGCRVGRMAGATPKSCAFRPSQNCPTSLVVLFFVFSELRAKRSETVSHLIVKAGSTLVALVGRRNARRRGSCEREARMLFMLCSISAALARCVRGRGAQVPVDVLPGLPS